MVCCQKKSPKIIIHDNCLNIAFPRDPLTLDPRKNADPISCQIISHLFEGLMQLESDGSVSFALAKSLEITNNNMKYTFHLRDSYWSDGHPVTAHDFIYAWTTMLDPNFPSVNANLLYCIKNAKKAKNSLIELDKIGFYAPDNKTLVIKLEYPTPFFLELLTFCTFYPVPKHIVEQKPYWPIKDLQPFISNGPFLLDKWQRNIKLILTKNLSYWNKKNVSLEKIIIHTIQDSQTSLSLFQDNELDFIGATNNPIPYDAINFLKNDPQYFVKEFAGTECCFFNSKCFPLNNINIRKALYYAIDRKSIIENITQTNQKVAFELIPPLLKQGISSKYLPEGSKELSLQYFKKGLEELGIDKNLFPKLTFSYYNSAVNKKIAEYLQETWKTTLDLTFNIEGLDTPSFLNKINNKNFHFCLMSIYAQYNDAYNYLERFLYKEHPKNYCSYENIKYQNIVTMANESYSPLERHKLINKAELLFLSDLSCGPLFHCSNAYLKNPQMEGLLITPIGSINFSRTFFKNPNP